MSWQTDITNTVANIIERLNTLTEQARKIFELPWQSILNPASKIHVSNGSNESEFVTIQQILDAAISFRQNQLLNATIDVVGNDVTVDSGAKWVINNINYELASDFVVNVPYAETGYTRNDILYADQFNQIHRQAGPETEGVSPTPNTPLNTVLVTIISVTDSTIGNNPPVITTYNTSDITNVSDVPGVTATDALNNLLNAGFMQDMQSVFDLGRTWFKNISSPTTSTLFSVDDTDLGTENGFAFYSGDRETRFQQSPDQFGVQLGALSEDGNGIGFQFEKPTGGNRPLYHLDNTKTTGDYFVATTDEVDLKLNISDYNEHFRGKYTSLALLQAAITTGNDGDYAIVDTGTGVNAKEYIWDTEEGWIQSSSASASTTDALPEGSTNLYFTTARVLATVLTGISFVTGTAVTDADSILVAFGKIQKQINDILVSIGLKQDALVSGTNIKTVNNNSLLGPGNLETFNRSFAILDDNFEDGTNSDLTLSTGWSVGSDGIAISSSGGWSNSALYNKYTTIDRVSTRALIQVITTTSIFSIIRKPTGLSQFGTVAQVDLSAMRLNFYASWDGSTTVPSVAKFVAIPFTIIANRKYLVELTKNKAVSVFTFTDETNPANTISLSFNQEAEGLSAIGRQWTSPGVMFNSGSIKLKRFTYATTFPNAPKLLITGHSFVEGYALIDQGDVSKTYSNLMYDALIGNVAIAGRGGETITTINTRNDIDFFSPTYHLVDIGSNDTVYATWLAGIQTYIAKIVAAGSIPVLATIVPRSDRQSFINQCNDWIRLSGYNYVDFAKSVTVNNDGITQDTSLFWTDSVHPNIAGNAKMFQQIKIDAPFLWDGYAKPVASVANLDMVEVPKTASFAVSLADSGKLYVINSASAVVVTFPTAMTAGKWWEFLSIGTGAVSFVAGSSATLISPDSRLKLRTQYSTARVIARASNQGSLGGDIVL